MDDDLELSVYELFPRPETARAEAEIRKEIDDAVMATVKSYKNIEKLIKEYSHLGTQDTESRKLIWDHWEISMEKAVRGKM
jgi:hypothetical protein